MQCDLERTGHGGRAKTQADGRIEMDGTHYATIGMDVSDRKTQVCVMAEDGK